jgi:hypothetical protein
MNTTRIVLELNPRFRGQKPVGNQVKNSKDQSKRTAKFQKVRGVACTATIETVP